MTSKALKPKEHRNTERLIDKNKENDQQSDRKGRSATKGWGVGHWPPLIMCWPPQWEDCPMLVIILTNMSTTEREAPSNELKHELLIQFLSFCMPLTISCCHPPCHPYEKVLEAPLQKGGKSLVAERWAKQFEQYLARSLRSSLPSLFLSNIFI